MHFIDNVDLVAATRRGVANFLTQITDFIDAAVGGAIDLQDV
jgi:hypothetical protein